MTPFYHKNPQLINSAPWEEIERYYKNLVSEGLKYEGMVDLIKHIRQSGLADRIYAFTSLFTLVVTIYDPAELHRETLHVTYNISSNEWHFVFHPSPLAPVEKEKSYRANEVDGFTIFSRYIELLKW